MENITPNQERILKANYFAYNIIYFVAGLIEALLLLRFIFKLLGASPANSLIAALYSASSVLTSPFAGIFPTASSGSMVFEFSVLAAMVFYAIVAYILDLLLSIWI